MQHGGAAPVREKAEALLFEATRWSIVRRARDQSTVALNELFTQYRRPLLVYLRARGHAPDVAEELVQGFCADLLARPFLENVAPEGGRFRAFLLASLRNHLCDEYDKANAIKRGGGVPPDSLDRTNEHGQPVHAPPSPTRSADEEYDRSWAQTVLANALRRVSEEAAVTGHTALLKELEPVLFAEETSPSYRAIGERLGLSEGAVRTAAHRVRARIKGAVRDEILQTVDNQQDCQDEIRYLISLFSR